MQRRVRRRARGTVTSCSTTLEGENGSVEGENGGLAGGPASTHRRRAGENRSVVTTARGGAAPKRAGSRRKRCGGRSETGWCGGTPGGVQAEHGLGAVARNEARVGESVGAGRGDGGCWRCCGDNDGAKAPVGRKTRNQMQHNQTEQQFVLPFNYELGTGMFLKKIKGQTSFIKLYAYNITYDACAEEGQNFAAFKWVPHRAATAAELTATGCGKPCTHTCADRGCMCNGSRCE